ncbi:MAG: S46 family peptidase, partial [Bacteroidales bacterium]|nr:S46 family peptidase [Bacteroidales bacterium]
MKYRFFVLLSGIMLFSQIKLKADEGMWLLSLIEKFNYADMQKQGFKLTPEQIYSINKSSLKDAVCQFAGGCTSEIVSSEGLLLTNHHCGYGSIQALSSVEHDYLTNGFWAYSKGEELACEGLTVKFLVRMEDVSEKILSPLQDTMSENSRYAKILEIAKNIEKEAIKNTHYEAQVKSFFNGNQYFLFIFETFKDVRLVGTPPNSIGKFGGDTDNWMWPRHTCDFSMFRIYMSPDGKPATYSKDNIPLKPKHFLPVSLNGVKKNDFAMIIGFPGTTDRFLTSYGVQMAIEKLNPSIVKIREKKLEILKEDMNNSVDVRIKYSAKYAGISNYWKYYMGQTRGLKRLKVYDKKVDIEKQFTSWLNSDSRRKALYADALPSIAKAYAEISKTTVLRIYLSEAIWRGPEIIGMSRSFFNLYNLMNDKKTDKARINKEAENLKNSLDKYFKDYNLTTDKKLFAAMFTMFYNDVKKEEQPKIIIDIAKKHKNDFNSYTESVYKNSIFTDKNKILAFLNNPKIKILKNDEVFKFYLELKTFSEDLNNKTEKSYNLMDRGNRLFVKGLMEMQPDKKFYPNANSTMRMTYGTVQDYYPADAVHYDYVTTLKGVIEKEDPANDDFIVPE